MSPKHLIANPIEICRAPHVNSWILDLGPEVKHPNSEKATARGTTSRLRAMTPTAAIKDGSATQCVFDPVCILTVYDRVLFHTSMAFDGSNSRFCASLLNYSWCRSLKLL